MMVFKQHTSRFLLSACCLTMLTSFSVSAGTLNEITKEVKAPIAQQAQQTIETVVIDIGEAPQEPQKPKFEEGQSTYSGRVETTNIANLTVTTQHGDLPVMLLCKANVKDWGLMPVYLDQITDETIRYRRPGGSRSEKERPPALIFSSKGEFIRTEGVFPPSDCNEKNILK